MWVMWQRWSCDKGGHVTVVMWQKWAIWQRWAMWNKVVMWQRWSWDTWWVMWQGCNCKEATRESAFEIWILIQSFCGGEGWSVECFILTTLFFPLGFRSQDEHWNINLSITTSLVSEFTDTCLCCSANMAALASCSSWSLILALSIDSSLFWAVSGSTEQRKCTNRFRS